MNTQQPMTLTGTQRVFVTGGAGFIGSHVVDLLIGHGYEVAIFDNLHEQIHGVSPIIEDRIPEWTKAQINSGAKFFLGDVRDRTSIISALVAFRPQIIVHLAAEVGVGQGEHEVSRYIATNVLGTANLIEAIQIANDTIPDDANLDGIRRLVSAGSMSSYGEGLYFCPEHAEIRGARSAGDILDQKFDVSCPYNGCGISPLKIVAIPEWSSLRPAGIYALTKRDTEEITLNARKLGLSCAVLRFFNVLGPRQSLSNPYTGVCAIFAARALAGLPIRVYEDGEQARDFIHVSDVASAVMSMVGPPQMRLALRLFQDERYQGAFNVSTGTITTIAEVAHMAADEINKDVPIDINMQARVGDIRACVGDAGKLTNLTGWRPLRKSEEAIRDFFRSVKGQIVSADHDLERAHNDLVDRRLVLSTEEPIDDADPHEEMNDAEDRSAWLGPVGPIQFKPDARFEDEQSE